MTVSADEEMINESFDSDDTFAKHTGERCLIGVDGGLSVRTRGEAKIRIVKFQDRGEARQLSR